MIDYQFEIVYDLVISPIDNISESVGFELCLGVCNWLLKDRFFYSDWKNINDNEVINNLYYRLRKLHTSKILNISYLK